MTRQLSLEPFPKEHHAWRALHEHFVRAMRRQNAEAQDAFAPEVESFDAFYDACGRDLRVRPAIKTDGPYFEVVVRNGNHEWTPILRVHHLLLGLDLDDIAADVALADYVGRTYIDVPDDPSQLG